MFASTYHPELRVMIHDSQDSVGLTDLLFANQNWFGHELFDPTRPVIWDLHDYPITMSIDEMRNVYSVTRSALGERKRQGGRTAWVHATALVRAMIEVVRDEFNWGSNWETFDVRDDALRWCLDTDIGDRRLPGTLNPAHLTEQ